MSKLLLVAVLSGLLTFAVVGCGGEEKAKSESDGPVGTALDVIDDAKDVAAQTQDRVDELDQLATQETPEAAQKYQTVHDPDAIYSSSDIPALGSYLKVNFGDLNSGQLNRVVHRLRTEVCTCGCPKDTIDECLVNDPQCQTAVQLTEQVIREEKLKG